MAEKHPTIFVQRVVVTDPESHGLVEIEIRKDTVTGAMVGIDGSFLEADVDEVYDPYNKGDILLIPDDEK